MLRFARFFQVLHCYRQLLRARSHVFKDDTVALVAIRATIRDEFEKNRNETNEQKIQQVCDKLNVYFYIYWIIHFVFFFIFSWSTRALISPRKCVPLLYKLD